MPGLEDYASPILRCAVFRQLNPGAQIAYSIVPIGNAFALGHTTYEGKATEAVKCEIVFDDGTYIVAHKEIDKVEILRNGPKDVPQTPEQLAKDETKALGRALRDAGIPQRLSELKILMQWISTLDGRGNGKASVASTLQDVTDVSAEEVDDADAGAQEPTPEQLVAQRFAMLNGADKAAVVKYAREVLNLGNVMRSGEHAEALMAYIDNRGWLVVEQLAAEAAGVVFRELPPNEPTAAPPTNYSQPPLPEEESF